MASEKPFRDVRKKLEAKGYCLARIKGSHHVFKKPGVGSFTIPVHRGKVKAYYVRQIEKL